ncbi:Flp family type IVb pilin [Bradyrhizobium tunisiense]|uniref:Flp family type IVb pilin n=1 Tax=Bradyrhizobium tunisiense TaxID=3278709 RepID=UPI0035D7D6BE
MLKYYIKTTEALKQLRKDQDGVVSFEYIIVAAAVITVVIGFFAGTGSTSIQAALTTAVGKITTAIATPL